MFSFKSFNSLTFSDIATIVRYLLHRVRQKIDKATRANATTVKCACNISGAFVMDLCWC